MNSIRVGLTCDFLRFVPEKCRIGNFQNRNLAWLVELLRPALTQACNSKVSVISASEDPVEFKQLLGSDTMLSEYIEDADLAWARHYDTYECDAFVPLFESLYQQDLIVGFEIPPTIKRKLHTHAKRYINFYIHPIRFLRDICFGANTNCPDIARILSTYTIDPSETSHQVRRFRALFSHLKLPACSLPSDIPLLIGQTSRDSILIRNASFTNWNNFEPALTEFLRPYDAIAFMEHPYQPSNTSTVEFFRHRLHKNIIATKGNSYGLIFSNDTVPFALTLSSSLGVEAETIGHTTHFLLDDPRRKFQLAGVDQPILPMLGHAILDGQFWQDITTGLQSRTATSDVDGFYLGDHFLRNSLDSWSYRALQHGLKIEPSFKTIIPVAEAAYERLMNLADACCGLTSEGADTPNQRYVMAKRNGIDFRILPPPLTISQHYDLPINAGEGTYYLIKGFHIPEDWGVWSSERHSSVMIPLSIRSGYMARLRIGLVIKMFDGIKREAPVLLISSNNRTIGLLCSRPRLTAPYQIEFELMTSDHSCQIDFELTDLQSPAANGTSKDPRMLGFGLLRFTVEYVTETSELTTPEETGYLLWGVDSTHAEVIINNIKEQST